MGALVPGLPVVLCGSGGSGRTVICLQQVDAVVARGVSVALLTSESPRLLLHQAAALGLRLDRTLRQQRLRLLELEVEAPELLRTHGGEALAESILEAAPGAGLVVIDPLTALTSNLFDETQSRAAIRGLFESLAAAGSAVLITAEREALEASPGLARALDDACGIFAELEIGAEGGRTLRVTRSRTTGCQLGPLAFEIGDAGPVLAPGAVAGEPPPMARPPEVDPAAESREPPPAARPLEPAPAPPPPDPAPAAQASEPGSEPRRRILVVEDEAVTRTMLCDWLSGSYEVDVAEDGFAAISAVLHRAPDLLILDLVLPRASGYEVLSALRGAGASLPVLIVSAHLFRASDRIRLLVLGASDLMAKPAQRFELLHKVDALLRYAPPPKTLEGIDDAEALLGDTQERRRLDDAELRRRLERAASFGQQFDLPSSLVAVEASSAEVLDALVGVCERRLRPEDALLLTSKRRAILLLVACQIQTTEPVLKRLGAGLEEAGTSPRQLRYRAWKVRSRPPEQGWEDLFSDLERWP